MLCVIDPQSSKETQWRAWRYDRGKPAVREIKEIGWETLNNGLKLKIAGKLPIILEEFVEYNKGESEDLNL